MRILYTVVALLLCGLLSADAQNENDVTDMEDELCPRPPPIENGYAEQAIRYKCNKYYTLKSDGDGIYTLNKDKQWDIGEKLPTCEAVCGKPETPAKPVQRIIGGSLDAKGSFPWQGLLVSHKNLSSGATLISDQWLLTTAKNIFLSHNQTTTSLEDITPTLKLFLGKMRVDIDHVILHPDSSMVDIALIKLKSKVVVNEKVMPICLPQKDYVEVGRVGYVSGWGRNSNFAFTERLKYVMLPVADNEKCIEHYEGSTDPEKKKQTSPVGVQPILNQHTFCAGMTRFREDTCYGDAGSAFAIHDEADDTWYAAGILSFDKSCAVAEYGVYVKVPSILDWIRETIATN